MMCLLRGGRHPRSGWSSVRLRGRRRQNEPRAEQAFTRGCFQMWLRRPFVFLVSACGLYLVCRWQYSSSTGCLLSVMLCPSSHPTPPGPGQLRHLTRCTREIQDGHRGVRPCYSQWTDDFHLTGHSMGQVACFVPGRALPSRPMKPSSHGLLEDRACRSNTCNNWSSVLFYRQNPGGLGRHEPVYCVLRIYCITVTS
ncbi:hypothetical protein M432DRAFT_162788 [Thermoascus aurantiacus ATCC 26904]